MTQKSPRSKCQSNHSIDKILRTIPLKKIAERSGFQNRKPRKIHPYPLIKSFFEVISSGRNTVENWAQQISLLTGKTVSKQGLYERIDGSLSEFLWQVLQHCFHLQINFNSAQRSSGALSKYYKQIVLEDSTVIKLPDWLAWCYPGNISGGVKKSQLKIQLMYECFTARILYLKITPYTTNDQSQAKEILDIAQKGTLVLRDLGYFSLESTKEMLRRSVSFVTRFRKGLAVYCKNSGDRINLANYLRKHGGIDKEVLIGAENKVLVRLVAVKTTESEAEYQRRKARNDRDRRSNHSKEFYELLGYKIFITSEPVSKLSTEQIIQIYRLRWRVEIIFKTWKCCFNIQKLIPFKKGITKERVEATMYLALIYILLFQVRTYAYLAKNKCKYNNGEISLIRISQFVWINTTKLLNQSLADLKDVILQFCKYDKRKDIKNFESIFWT